MKNFTYNTKVQKTLGLQVKPLTLYTKVYFVLYLQLRKYKEPLAYVLWKILMTLEQIHVEKYINLSIKIALQNS